MHLKSLSVLTVLLMLSALLLFACDEITDEVNEATAQTKSFQKDIKPGIPIPPGQAGACSPTLVTFDSLLSEVSVWEDIKGNIDEISINELTYTIDPNKNATDGKVNIYVTDNPDYFKDENGTPPESDRIGSTATIPAGEKVKDEPVQYANGGKETLEELMLDYEEEFVICIGWTGNEDDVDMTLEMSIDVDVVLVPIGD
jgi:hypothetical protein